MYIYQKRARNLPVHIYTNQIRNSYELGRVWFLIFRVYAVVFEILNVSHFM